MVIHICKICIHICRSTGWWFEILILFSPIVGMMILSDFHIFRVVAQPPTNAKLSSICQHHARRLTSVKLGQNPSIHPPQTNNQKKKHLQKSIGCESQTINTCQVIPAASSPRVWTPGAFHLFPGILGSSCGPLPWRRYTTMWSPGPLKDG